jgi:hypothetical protein
MVMPYITDARVGDGYRTAFVMKERGETVLLFVHNKMVTVTVPLASVTKAARVPYKPAEVRSRILTNARYYRQHGKRFPRQQTVELLRRLGAARAAIEQTINTDPLPETIAAKNRRLEEAMKREVLAGVAAAIRDKIDNTPPTPEPIERPAHAKPRKPARHVHPDQFSLGL